MCSDEQSVCGDTLAVSGCYSVTGYGDWAELEFDDNQGWMLLDYGEFDMISMAGSWMATEEKDVQICIEIDSTWYGCDVKIQSDCLTAPLEESADEDDVICTELFKTYAGNRYSFRIDISKETDDFVLAYLDGPTGVEFRPCSSFGDTCPTGPVGDGEITCDTSKALYKVEKEGSTGEWKAIAANQVTFKDETNNEKMIVGLRGSFIPDKSGVIQIEVRRDAGYESVPWTLKLDCFTLSNAAPESSVYAPPILVTAGKRYKYEIVTTSASSNVMIELRGSDLTLDNLKSCYESDDICQLAASASLSPPGTPYPTPTPSATFVSDPSLQECGFSGFLYSIHGEKDTPIWKWTHNADIVYAGSPAFLELKGSWIAIETTDNFSIEIWTGKSSNSGLAPWKSTLDSGEFVNNAGTNEGVATNISVSEGCRYRFHAETTSAVANARLSWWGRNASIPIESCWKGKCEQPSAGGSAGPSEFPKSEAGTTIPLVESLGVSSKSEILEVSLVPTAALSGLLDPSPTYEILKASPSASGLPDEFSETEDIGASMIESKNKQTTHLDWYYFTQQ
jgi:hypothetical protein